MAKSTDEIRDQPSTSDEACVDTSNKFPTTRSEVLKVDWTKCIFCQSRKHDKIHLVQTINVDTAIKKIAVTNHIIKCRIGQNDLIAYETHYHKSCKHQAEKIQQTHYLEDQTEDSYSKAWVRLTEILDFGIHEGHVFLIDSILRKFHHILVS